MTHIKHPVLSIVLVLLQFSLMAALLLLLPLNLSISVLAIQGFAILVGLWAVLTMRIGHFNIVPDPQFQTQLVNHGPYRFIRHPMYFSILVFFLPLIILNLSWLGLALYVSLSLTLLIKLHYEEHLLSNQLSDYADYQKNTKKLIPFIF